MKILITGVAGLLGSRLADWIIDEFGYTVIGIDDLSGGFRENINTAVIFYEINLYDLNAVKEVFRKEEPEFVYHFAAYAAEGLSPFIRKYNYQNNLISSANLISCSIQFGIKKFIFASSMSVYGNSYTPPFDEKLRQAPIDPYAIAKYAVEMDLQVAYEQHGLNYVIIRPHNFYGIKQNIWDKYRNVLGIWMYQIINDLPPTIFGDGNQTRAFSYVDDALEPFWRALENSVADRQIINLGGIHEITIKDACECLIKVTGRDVKPVFLQERHESKHAWSTWEKSVRLLGFEHKVDLEEGLTRMWEWAQLQPKRKRFEWPEFELDKGIYSFWESRTTE